MRRALVALRRHRRRRRAARALETAAAAHGQPELGAAARRARSRRRAPKRLPPGARGRRRPGDDDAVLGDPGPGARSPHGRLTGVKTLALSGDGPHTQALNARAEPILRARGAEGGERDVDVVSGATYTSRSWKESLQAAIDKAEGR